MSGLTTFRVLTALTAVSWLTAHAAGADVDAMVKKYEAHEAMPAWHALVIGTRGYQQLERLDSAEADAKNMARLLRELGFEEPMVRSLRSIAELERDILPQFKGRLKRGDFVVVYLSGHGFTVGADSYYAAEDMPIALDKDRLNRHAVTIQGLQDYFAGTEPGEMLFLVDACRTIGKFEVRSGDGPNEARPGVSLPQSPLDQALPPAPGTLLKGLGSSSGQDSLRRVNTQVGYATTTGEAAIGFTGSKPSVFTAAVLEYLAAKGREFGDVWKDIGFVVVHRSSGAQQPVMSSASYANVYFNPDEDAAADALQAWRAALATGSEVMVEHFARRHALSRQAAAARKWLADRSGVSPTAIAAAVPPTEIERQWRPGQQPLSGAPAQGGLAFARSMTFTQAVPADDVVGSTSVAASGNGPSGLYRQLEVMRSFGAAVTTQALVTRTAPDLGAPVQRTVPPGTPLAIDEVRRAGDGGAWILARLPGTVQRMFLKVKPSPPLSPPVSIGAPLSEVVIQPRRAAWSDLVDAAQLVRAIDAQKAAGKEVQWISLATGLGDSARETWARRARAAHAALILGDLGVDPRRITYVSDVLDLDGPGVRVRMFGK